jgi:hypothetical protein
MAEEKVMELACCSREEAVELLKKTGNVVDAVSLHMNVPQGKDAPKPRQLSKIQTFFKETREEMTKLTESISKGFISDQPEHSEQDEMRSPPVEMAPQSNCLEQCHPLSPVLEVQIPEIACLLPSECSSDLQSNAQKLLCSDQECPQSCPCLETA